MSYIYVDPNQTHAKAITAGVTSITTAAATHFAQLNEILQVLGGAVAIGSGCMAIAFYYVSILEKLRNRKK